MIHKGEVSTTNQPDTIKCTLSDFYSKPQRLLLLKTKIFSKEMNGSGSCGVRQKEHCSALDTLISSSHLKLEIRVAARAEKLVGYRTSSNTFLVNHELIPLH